MFVRKGTTMRKKRQSMRRPRRPSAPSTSPTHPPIDLESGDCDLNSGVHQGRQSGGSSASSTLTLNDEKSLVRPVDGSNPERNFQSLQVSYGSILYQFREAQDESIDLYDFMQRLSEMAWQSLTLTVLLLLLLGLPVSMIAMGTSYLHECPKEPRIPIYLLVGGAFGAINICIIIWRQKRSRDYMLLDDSRDDDDDDPDDVMTRSYRFTGYMLSLFLLIWFGFGNYWLFSIWRPNFTQPLHEPRNWCAHPVYQLAFYQILIVHGLFASALLVVVGCLIVYCFRLRNQ